MPVISLILVTHNSGPWLRAFVESWEKSLAAAPALAVAGVDFIVADSGSTDDTLAVAEELAPGAKRIVCGNVGFGTAVNRAAAAAEPSWLLICNPDLTFPADFAARIEGIIVNAKNGGPQLAAPRLLNPDGSTQASVGKFPTIGSLLRDQLRPRERRKYYFPQPAERCRIDWASGACMLVAWDAFHAVGGFDGKYFLYVEEVDFQRRLRDAGHAMWFVPELTATHHHPNAARAPRPEVQRWAARGTLRYFAKFARGSLFFYRWLAVLTGRLTAREGLAGRRAILEKATGP